MSLAEKTKWKHIGWFGCLDMFMWNIGDISEVMQNMDEFHKNQDPAFSHMFSLFHYAPGGKTGTHLWMCAFACSLASQGFWGKKCRSKIF